MTDANYKEQLLKTFKLLSEKYPDNGGRHGSSKASFMLFLEPDALSISNYWDANNLKNISDDLFQIAVYNNGKIRNNIAINEQEDPELYNAGLLKEYEINKPTSQG